MKKYTKYKIAKKIFRITDKLKLPEKHPMLDIKINDRLFQFVEGKE